MGSEDASDDGIHPHEDVHIESVSFWATREAFDSRHTFNVMAKATDFTKGWSKKDWEQIITGRSASQLRHNSPDGRGQSSRSLGRDVSLQ